MAAAIVENVSRTSVVMNCLDIICEQAFKP